MPDHESAPGSTAQVQPVATVPPQGKALSIISMSLGILGIVLSFVLWGFLPALAAVITGHIAQGRQKHAKPFWLTGLILGYIGLVVGIITGLVLALIYGIGIFALLFGNLGSWL